MSYKAREPHNYIIQTTLAEKCVKLVLVLLIRREDQRLLSIMIADVMLLLRRCSIDFIRWNISPLT